jgi:lactate dehydrogenase-like 2-hydroxyacid dehydrogenase
MIYVAVRRSDPITRKVFGNSSRLLIVARHCVGYDRVDVEATAEHGVWVTVTPVKELFLAVAKHIIALIMCSASLE